MGPPVWLPVLDPLAAYTSTTAYICATPGLLIVVVSKNERKSKNAIKNNYKLEFSYFTIFDCIDETNPWEMVKDKAVNYFEVSFLLPKFKNPRLFQLKGNKFCPAVSQVTPLNNKPSPRCWSKNVSEQQVSVNWDSDYSLIGEASSWVLLSKARQATIHKITVWACSRRVTWLNTINKMNCHSCLMLFILDLLR